VGGVGGAQRQYATKAERVENEGMGNMGSERRGKSLPHIASLAQISTNLLLTTPTIAEFVVGRSMQRVCKGIVFFCQNIPRRNLQREPAYMLSVKTGPIIADRTWPWWRDADVMNRRVRAPGNSRRAKKTASAPLEARQRKSVSVASGRSLKDSSSRSALAKSRLR